APAPPAAPPAAATLPLTVKEDTPMGPYTLAIQGKATINGKEVVEYASVRSAVSQSLAGLAYPPRQLYTQLAVAVTEKPPFTLTAKFDATEVLRGNAVSLTINTTRAAGFLEEIAITATGVPANVAPMLKNIPKDLSEVKIQLTPAANA